MQWDNSSHNKVSSLSSLSQKYRKIYMNFFFNRIFWSRICPNTFLGIRVEYIHEKYGRLDQNPIAIHRSWFAIRLLAYTSFSWSAHGACTKFHLCLNCRQLQRLCQKEKMEIVANISLLPTFFLEDSRNLNILLLS